MNVSFAQSSYRDFGHLLDCQYRHFHLESFGQTRDVPACLGELRSYRKTTQDDMLSTYLSFLLPIQIVLEAIASFFLFIPGIVLASGPLEDVTWRGEMSRR
jgi:hypothetical protein